MAYSFYVSARPLPDDFVRRKVLPYLDTLLQWCGELEGIIAKGIQDQEHDAVLVAQQELAKLKSGSFNLSIYVLSFVWTSSQRDKPVLVSYERRTRPRVIKGSSSPLSMVAVEGAGKGQSKRGAPARRGKEAADIEEDDVPQGHIVFVSEDEALSSHDIEDDSEVTFIPPPAAAPPKAPPKAVATPASPPAKSQAKAPVTTSPGLRGSDRSKSPAVLSTGEDDPIRGAESTRSITLF